MYVLVCIYACMHLCVFLCMYARTYAYTHCIKFSLSHQRKKTAEDVCEHGVQRNIYNCTKKRWVK
jgi:hypothetical protein